MTDELNAAKLRIAQLEKELEAAKTPRQESNIEARLLTALSRLDALEKHHLPKQKEEATKEFEDEDDGDQCPDCGGTLYEIEEDMYKCSLCNQIWVENEK